MVHIYTGDGKGKTTAVIGAAVRAAATGKKVLFFQFLKNDLSGERRVLKKIENICLINMNCDVPFVFNMSDDEKNHYRVLYKEKLDLIYNTRSLYDFYVFDEAVTAIDSGLCTTDDILRFKDYGELFLSGRGSIEPLKKYADYITIMKKEKHPYDLGQPARAGIEF